MKKHSFVCSCIGFSFLKPQKDKECFVQNIKAEMVINSKKRLDDEKILRKKWGQNKPLFDKRFIIKFAFEQAI